MKKYVFSFLAITAALALNAFSTQKHPISATGSDLVWYVVNGSNEIDPNSPINEDDPMTSDEFKTEFPSTCPQGSDAACVRGYLPTALPSAATDTGQEDILKDL
jgi:hypothetical protein